MTGKAREMGGVGRRLGSIRARKGLSQGTLSRLAGMAPSYLSRIENGRLQPTLPTLLRLMRALRVGFEDVIGPEVPRGKHAEACPISPAGECLCQLIRSDAEVVRDRRRVFYSSREIELLRGLARWMKTASPERVRALETVIEEVTRPGNR